jgi:glucose-1-phosphate adenylyltransferase
MREKSALPVDLNQALKDTLALVLAGGRGSRLMSLTDHEAKPAIPFGGKFRIIDFPLSNCINSGIRRVSVLTQYKAHSLIHHVQRGWGFFRAELNEFVELWPAQQQTVDESWYVGTADAVYQNLRTIGHHAPKYVLILAGDHVYKQDYSKMLAHHIEQGAEATVACVEVNRQDATGFGVVGVDTDDNIVSFIEKPADPPSIPGKPNRAYASMGIYIFNTDFLFELLKLDSENQNSSHDFGKDIVPHIVEHHSALAHDFSRSAVKMSGSKEPYWRDVGTLDAYWEAVIDLTTVTPQLDLYDESWPIWTYQVQRPSAKFVFDDDDRRGMAVDSLVSAGCIISGATVRRTCLYNNVRVNSYSSLEDSVVLPDSDIARHCQLRKVLIDSGVRVPEGLQVGFDPTEDARRFHRTTGGVTLITSEMIAALS